LGGLFGKVSDPLAVKMFARQMRASLDTLQIILEEN
jgi:hypothetical protein